MRLLLLLAMVAGPAFGAGSRPLVAECTRPWLFFDTGNTLVDVPADYKNMQNHAGLEFYLAALKAEKFPLGIVINVPADWGDELADEASDPVARRILYTQQFFAEGWKPGAAVFPWDFFGSIEGSGVGRTYKGNVFFPMANAERKPANCATCVFNRALAEAKAAGCPAVFMGEDPGEMAGAESIGFVPFQVGHSDGANFFLAPEKIGAYVRGYKPGRWKKGE